MSFLAELAILQDKVIHDLADQSTQKAVGAYKEYVQSSLESMKRGIYNEFRRQVVDKPKYTQYTLYRTITPNTELLAIGFIKTVTNKDAFDAIIAHIRSEFPECVVNCRAEGSRLRINFTVFVNGHKNECSPT